MDVPQTVSDYAKPYGSPERVEAGRDKPIGQTNERLDAEIAALGDRLELLSHRLLPVLQMEMPRPEQPGPMQTDQPVGDHSSTIAQEQWSRSMRVASLTSAVNSMLERLEL